VDDEATEDEDEDEEEDDDDESGDGNNAYCEVCNGVGELVCCDFCECSYHGPKCLNAKAEDLPDPWKCPKCTGTLATVKAEYKKRRQERKMAKEGKRATGKRAAKAEDSDEDGEDQGVSVKGKPQKGKPEKRGKSKKILDSDDEMEDVDEDDGDEDEDEDDSDFEDEDSDAKPAKAPVVPRGTRLTRVYTQLLGRDIQAASTHSRACARVRRHTKAVACEATWPWQQRSQRSSYIGVRLTLNVATTLTHREWRLNWAYQSALRRGDHAWQP
jgi:hypothetical protein